jgi:hypothetical protein
MRINTLWRFWEWLPAAMAMPRMLSELGQHPELGLLGVRSYLSGRVVMTVQYWRSFDHLEQYAKARNREHLPAWKSFYERARKGAGAVGIFHETYVVAPGNVESLYVNMPGDFGLAGAVGGAPVGSGREVARDRLAA